MATSPEAVREELVLVTAAASQQLRSVGPSLDNVLAAVDLIVPDFYDAAAALAVAWFDEIRAESSPATNYAPRIIGDPATDWIEREVEAFGRTLEADLDQQMQAMLDEAIRLAEKEVARGYRDTILGNVRIDEDAIGWSRVARPGACKFCVMLASRGAVYMDGTANFAAHTNCNCACRPTFRNGERGPEASVEQYKASQRRRTPEEQKKLREYLNENFPDAPG